jgi:hypothetical protein
MYVQQELETALLFNQKYKKEHKAAKVINLATAAAPLVHFSLV